MSLKQARQITKRAKKAGRCVEIRVDSAACDEHNPRRHRMSGNHIVIDLATGQCIWE